MRPIELDRDILPIAQFKAHASELVQRVKNERRPVVVTVNGLPAAVLISPADFDEHQQAAYVRAKIERGQADIEAGRVISDADLTRWADKRYGKRSKRR